MGGHGHEPYKIPEPSLYKIEAPQLVEVQTALARLGLKDPWLRNEAWRYMPQHGTHVSRALKFFTRGLVVGLAAAIITAGVEKAFDDEDDHGHGGHH